MRRTVKTDSSRGGRKKEWRVSNLSGEVVPRIEDALYLEYHRRFLVVCFAETSKRLPGEGRPQWEAPPRRVEQYDTVYQRSGIGNPFMFYEPKGVWLHVEVPGSRAAEQSPLVRTRIENILRVNKMCE